MRILITGSRDWSDKETIRQALLSFTAEVEDPNTVCIIHGGCSTGADFIANHLALEYGFRLEVVEADWNAFGRSAGPKRNAEMVRRGADICLAFLNYCSKKNCSISFGHYSHGAKDCLSLAARAGIPVQPYCSNKNCPISFGH